MHSSASAKWPGAETGGAAEDGPLQNFRWTGQRCLCPPQKNFKNINFSVFPTARTGSCALCVVLKLQYYMGYCLSFRFYLFTHRKHLNGTSPKHRGLNAHFQPVPLHWRSFVPPTQDLCKWHSIWLSIVSNGSTLLNRMRSLLESCRQNQAATCWPNLTNWMRFNSSTKLRFPSFIRLSESLNSLSCSRVSRFVSMYSSSSRSSLQQHKSYIVWKYVENLCICENNFAFTTSALDIVR